MDRRRIAATRDATDGVQLLVTALQRMSPRGQRTFARRPDVRKLVRILCPPDGDPSA
jgi:hypothetical protein